MLVLRLKRKRKACVMITIMLAHEGTSITLHTSCVRFIFTPYTCSSMSAIYVATSTVQPSLPAHIYATNRAGISPSANGFCATVSTRCQSKIVVVISSFYE
jgi:hypothetical protein